MPTGMLSILQILSGALAALLIGRYFVRRRAHLAVVSVTPSARLGLRGELVDLEPSVREIVKKFRYASLGRDPQDREDIVTMNRVLRNARLFKRASVPALKELDSSIGELNSTSPTRDIIKRAIERVLGVHVLGHSLRGMSARKSLTWPDPPDDLNSATWIVPVQDEPIGAGFAGVSGRVLLDCSTSTVGWHYSDPYAKAAALRLACGVGNPELTTVRDNFRRLRDELLEDMTVADSVIAELAPLLLANSRWVVTLQVANVGASPIVLAPSATLMARSGGRKYGPLSLQVRNNLESTLADTAGRKSGLTDKLKGEDDETDPIEKEFSRFGVTLPPDEDVVRANLVVSPATHTNAVFFSSRRIGEEAPIRELAEFWEKGLAEFRVSVTLRPRGLRVLSDIRSRWTPA